MDFQQIAKMLSQMEANRKADWKADQKMVEENQAKAEAERKADRKMMEENQAKAEAKAAANLADMKESLKEAMRVAVSAIEGKMEAIVHSTRPERDEEIPRWSENITERQEIPKEGAAVGNMDGKDQGPKEMDSGAECQLVPMEEVARKSSRMKKRPRG
jgi:hypothetical protein